MTSPFRNYTAFTTVSSGGQLSGLVDIEGIQNIAIWSPVVTSCQMFFLGSFGQASANFIRIGDAETTVSHLEWNVETGSRTIAIIGHVSPYPFIKLELSVAQTDTRTFSIIGKRIP